MSALDDLKEILELRKKVVDLRTENEQLKEVNIALNEDNRITRVENEHLKQRIAELEAETLSLHHVISECEDNLKSMVEQYCRGHNFNQNDPSKYEYAHEFMSAGECTFEYLVARGLAEYTENGVDIRLVKK